MILNYLTILFISLCTVFVQEEDHRFVLNQEGYKWTLTDKKLNTEFVIPEIWFVDSLSDFSIVEEDDIYEQVIPYFNVNANYLGLLVSNFSIDGKFASGIDIIIIYNPEKQTYEKFGISNEPVRGRYPGPCRGAYETFYVLGDLDEDGNIDLGVVKEEIKCDWSGDEPVSKQYFIQHLVEWSLWDEDQWVFANKLRGVEAKDYQIKMVRYPASVDVSGYNFWRHYNPLKWNLKNEKEPEYWPPQRLERAIKESEMKRDVKILRKLKKLN